MAYQSTYLAAKFVSTTLEAHFKEHISEAAQKGEADLAHPPSAKVAEAIIDAAFWASLRREEGHSPRISLAFLPPEQAGSPLLFGQKLPLIPDILTKVAPGVERAGIHMGVWYDENGLYIWGTTLKLPNFCFVLDVSEPGLMVIKRRRMLGLGKFTNIAVLKGDQVKVVDEDFGGLPDSPEILNALLGYHELSAWSQPVNVLIQVAVSMRAHQRGGSVLVVPSGSNKWLDSIIQPMQYPVVPAFCGLADLVSSGDKQMSDIFWQSALRREVDNLAGLTAIDGVTIINDKHELLAFGAKTGRAVGNPLIEELAFLEPIVGSEVRKIHPGKVGGTRHLSGAQFVHDQKDALAMVASQDGHFTIFSWSNEKEMVQAHRIDTLLL